MTTQLTALPTRTADSIGETKEDPGLAVASRYQLRLAEEDRQKDLLIETCTVIGVQDSTAVGAINSGSPTGTVRGIVDALGNGNPHRYLREFDRFMYRDAGAVDPKWDPGGGGVYTSGLIGGGLEASQNMGGADSIADWSFQFQRGNLLWLEFAFRYDDIQNTSPELRVGFLDTIGNDGFLLQFNPSASTTAVNLLTLRGGTQKTKKLFDLTAYEWTRCRIWLTPTAGAYYARGLAWDKTSSGVVETVTAQEIDSKDFRRIIFVGAGSNATKLVHIKNLETRADFGEVADW